MIRIFCDEEDRGGGIGHSSKLIYEEQLPSLCDHLLAVLEYFSYSHLNFCNNQSLPMKR